MVVFCLSLQLAFVIRVLCVHTTKFTTLNQKVVAVVVLIVVDISIVVIHHGRPKGK